MNNPGCSRSLTFVLFKSRQQVVQDSAGTDVKRDCREEDNILARLHALKQRQPPIHPSCGGSCEGQEGKKTICLSVHPSIPLPSYKQALTSSNQIRQMGNGDNLLHSTALFFTFLITICCVTLLQLEQKS